MLFHLALLLDTVHPTFSTNPVTYKLGSHGVAKIKD